VLVDTLYPLVAEAVRGVKVSVGALFFNRMSLPMIVVLLFLMGVGPALPLKSASCAELRAKLLPTVAGTVVMTAVALQMGIHSLFGVTRGLCGCCVTGPISGLRRRCRSSTTPVFQDSRVIPSTEARHIATVLSHQMIHN
jgi:cytochrome c biogenesis factor